MGSYGGSFPLESYSYCPVRHFYCLYGLGESRGLLLKTLIGQNLRMADLS